MKKIFVAGHNGMVGRALTRALSQKEDLQLITVERTELDLLSQTEVNRFLRKAKPDEIIIAAAKVGGIEANNTSSSLFIKTCNSKLI